MRNHVTSDNERPVPRKIEALQQVWEQFRTALRANDAALEACDQGLSKITHADYTGFSDTVQSDRTTAVIENLISLVLEEARIDLAPTGTKLEIQREEDIEFIPRYRQYHHEDNLDDLSLVDIYQTLAVKFGGICGVQRAARDAAKQLYEQLSHSRWGDRGDTVAAWSKECDDGDLWMHASVAGYTNSKPLPGHNEYDYNVTSNLHATLTSLVTLCAIYDVDFIPSIAPALTVSGIGMRRAFKYGQKIEVSDDLTLVCRKDKIEYRASRRLCALLKEFIITNAIKPVTIPDESDD